MSWTFLTARWEHLIVATYAVPPEMLASRLPAGLELDIRDGRAFVSLVGFQFLDTRVLGVPWPGFRNFPEWNLRYYVRRGSERGVVFVREFVPQLFVAWVARTIYNEPYLAAPITGSVSVDPTSVTAEYRVIWGGRTHTLRAVGDPKTRRPLADGAEALLRNLSWGYGTTRGGRLIRYEVRHPEWDVFPLRECVIDLDWAALYGPEWAVMQKATPVGTLLAAGSPVAVYPYGTVRRSG